VVTVDRDPRDSEFIKEAAERAREVRHLGVWQIQRRRLAVAGRIRREDRKAERESLYQRFEAT